MVRMAGFLACAAVVAAAIPAASQEPPASAAGRFLVTPGEVGGFVRMDTRTGVLSHCGQSNGVWSCEPFTDSANEGVAALSVEVAKLSARLDELARRMDGLSVVVAGDGAVPRVPADSEQGFADRIVGRFLEMVRKIKYDRAEES